MVKASGVAARILEEVAPVDIPQLINQPSSTLITTDVSFLNSSAAYKDKCFRVPLTTIMPKHLNRWNPVDWKCTGGHPALASAQNLNQRRQVSQDLQHHWKDKLTINPLAYDALEDLRNHPYSTPAEHYQRIRKDHGPCVKSTLDWLVCLGTIHRQKYRNGAGIVPIPLL